MQQSSVCGATLPALAEVLRDAPAESVDAASWDVFRVVCFEPGAAALPAASAALAAVCARCASPRDVQLSIASALADASVPLAAKLLVLKHAPTALLRVSPPERRQRFAFPLLRAALRVFQQQQQFTNSEQLPDADAEGLTLLCADDLSRASVPFEVVAAMAAFVSAVARGITIAHAAALDKERSALFALCTVLLAELGKMETAGDQAEADVLACLVALGFTPETLLAPLERSEDGSSESDSDSRGEEEEEQIPVEQDGIAVALWIAICKQPDVFRMPSVVAPRWKFNVSTPSAVRMVAQPNVVLQSRGWELVEALMRPIPRGSLRFGGGSSAVPSDLSGLFSAMLESMVHCSDATIRTQRFGVFSSSFEKLCAAARFDLLKQLLLTASSPVITCLLVRRLKTEIERAWPNVSEEQEDTVHFCSRRLLELFPIFMVATNLTERNEVILEALNLYRFLLIKDAATNYTGLWSSGQLAEVNLRFLGPLKNEVGRMREEYSAIQSDEDVQERIDGMKKLGLPSMSVAEFRQTNLMAITNVSLLENLIDRIHELVSTLSDSR